jgi:hypothetical protein
MGQQLTIGGKAKKTGCRNGHLWGGLSLGLVKPTLLMWSGKATAKGCALNLQTRSRKVIAIFIKGRQALRWLG